MKPKMLLALVLVLLMVLPVILACQNTTDDPGDTTPVSTGTSETEDPFDDKVPTVDYQEREFLIAAPEPWGDTYFDREEETAEAINDAIFTRNRALEERFNISVSSAKIGWTDCQASSFAPYAISGEDVVDMIGVATYQSGKPMITGGYALPCNDIPHINLNRM